MHMTSVRIDFGVRNHRRDRVERSFSRSTRVVCLQSSLALDQRRRLESGYKHGQVRFHLSDDNAARFVVKIDMVVYNFPRYKVSREEVEISCFRAAGRLFRARQAGKLRGLPRDGSVVQWLSWARLAGPSFLSTPREESSRRSPLAAELGALACQDR